MLMAYCILREKIAGMDIALMVLSFTIISIITYEFSKSEETNEDKALDYDKNNYYYRIIAVCLCVLTPIVMAYSAIVVKKMKN